MNLTQTQFNNKIIFIVDDDEAICDSISCLLKANNYAVKCFPSAEQFLNGCKPEEIGCLILDIKMKGMNGLALQEKMRSNYSWLPIIFLTGHANIATAVLTMKKGAKDFIEKPFKESQLLSLIDKMLVSCERERRRAKQQQLAEQYLAKLTRREREVLERIIAGRLNKQIADDLSISIKTVEVHRASVMHKMNVTTVADLLKLVLLEKTIMANEINFLKKETASRHVIPY